MNVPDRFPTGVAHHDYPGDETDMISSPSPPPRSADLESVFANDASKRYGAAA